MQFFLAVIFFVFANMLYTVHEHIKFNYKGSVFERWDKGLARPWWGKGCRQELQDKYRWLPMIWDGYHSIGWWMGVCAWGMFAVAIYDKLQGLFAVAYLGIWMGLFAFIIHNVAYGWFFKE